MKFLAANAFTLTCQKNQILLVIFLLLAIKVMNVLGLGTRKVYSNNIETILAFEDKYRVNGPISEATHSLLIFLFFKA